MLSSVIAPWREFPIEDDWDYAKTVWHLLHTGAFHRLEVTQATVFFPALWGGLFAALFGYSFAVLRLSTLVLAAGALILFGLLLGELGFDQTRRTLATLSLLVTPVFLYLAFSFMTDVPFLCGLMGALYSYVRARRRAEVRWAFVGSIFAALAFLARQLGALIPFAFGLFAVLDSPLLARKTGIPFRERLNTFFHTRLIWLSAGTLVPLIVLGVYLAWIQWGGGENWADRTRTLGGTLGFWLQASTLGVLRRRYVIAAATLGIYLPPLWAASSSGVFSFARSLRTLARGQQGLLILLTILFVITLAQLALHDEWFPYLTDILTRRGLRPYLAYFAYEMNAHRPFVFSLKVSAALTAIAGLLGISFSALMIGRLRARVSPELALVYLTTLVLAVFSLSFFTYFERHLFPLMPGAIILLLDVTRRARVSWLAGIAGLLVVASVSIALMQDYFAWNQTKWDAGRALLASDVPVEKIDGGYEWDGWYL